jgi:hypothetical protein
MIGLEDNVGNQIDRWLTLEAGSFAFPALRADRH